MQEKWNTSWTYLRLMDRFLIQGPDWTLLFGAYWNYRQFQERQEFDEDTPLGTQKFWSDDFGGDIAFTSNCDRYEFAKGFYVAPNVEWNMVNYPVDEANTLWADPYCVFGVRAGYWRPKGFEVFLEAKNLTNLTYAASVEAIRRRDRARKMTRLILRTVGRFMGE